MATAARSPLLRWRCRSRYCAVSALLLLLRAWVPSHAQPPDTAHWVGKPLSEVLVELQGLGLPLVFSSQLVPDQARVQTAPEGGTALEVLRDLLRPHGLAVLVSDAGLWLVVSTSATVHLAGRVVDEQGKPVANALVSMADRSARTSPDGTFRLDRLSSTHARLHVEAVGYQPLIETVEASRSEMLHLVLRALPVSREEIMVTARGVVAPREGVFLAPGGAVRAEDLARLPEITGDTLRAATRLPGVSGRFGAQPLIRGGSADEVGILVDGVELYSPYHLLDYGGLLSVLPGTVVGTVQVGSGNRDATYGDRLAGVVDLRTAEPDDDTAVGLEISPLAIAANGSGHLAGDRIGWLASGRVGLLDRVARVLEVDDRPVLWDGFAKASRSLNSSHSLRGSLLLSADDLDTDLRGLNALPDAETPSRFRSHASSFYFWVAHDNALSPSAFLDGVLSHGQTVRDRSTDTCAEPCGLEVLDRRRLLVQSWREDLTLLQSERASWQLGTDLRYLEAHYHYAGSVDPPSPLAVVRTNQSPFQTSFEGEVEALQGGAYVQAELAPTKSLGVVVGVRLEGDDITGEHRLSPRLHLVHQPSAGTRWTLSAASYTQLPRPNELNVEDGEDRLDRPEHAEEVALGLQHRLLARLRMRLDAWVREVDHPRTRWTNLFDPLSLVPEAELDRVLLVPQRSRSRGLQGSLSATLPHGVELEVSLGTVRARDAIAEEEVRRESDRERDVRARWGWQATPSLTLGAFWQYQSGWPTTALSWNAKKQPQLGVPFAQRLPPHRQLDLLLRKSLKLTRGSLDVDLVVENLTNERNVRGRDYTVEEAPTGSSLTATTRYWPGVLPSLKVLWRW